MASASLFSLSARVLIFLGAGWLAGQLTSSCQAAERKRLTPLKRRASNKDEIQGPNASILHSNTKLLCPQHHPGKPNPSFHSFEHCKLVTLAAPRSNSSDRSGPAQ